MITFKLETDRVKENQNRLMSIDYLKTMAIILVIITHSIQRDLYLKIGGPFWIDMAVPIFMIVSGFTYSMSADKSGNNKLKQFFNFKLLLPKLSRLLFPYIIIVSLEVVIYVFYEPKSLAEILFTYIIGGWGPGSYYVPILIQLLIVFPIIFLVFKKSPIKAISLCIGTHLAFDIVSNTLPMFSQSIVSSNFLYRLLIFRYLTFIVMGVILYHYKSKIMEMKFMFTLLSILSLIYIYICSYYGYIPIIFSKWNTTSMPTVFWAFGIILLAFRYLEIDNKNLLTQIANIISKSSYHIFLVQMVYFQFGLGECELLVLVHISICCIIGIAFYYCEIRIKKLSKNMYLCFKRDMNLK